LATAPMQRAHDLRFTRRMAKKAAVPLTKTLASPHIVRNPLEVHKPTRCLMPLVFTRGARSHADSQPR
jgi:hypothetical protein